MNSHTTTSEGTRRIGKGRSLAFFALSAALICSTALLPALDMAPENEDDARITSQVKESLLFHLLIDSRTETSGGVVTLSGHADDLAEKELGTSLAAGISGVKSVINNMILPVTLAGVRPIPGLIRHE